METEKDINAKIMAKIGQIKEQHPELTKYIDEMALSIPDESDPEINAKNLNDYYDMLNNMLEKYE